MKTKIIKFILLSLTGCTPIASWAEDMEITATYTNTKGVMESKTDNFTEEAPLHVTFTTNVSALDAGATIEWHFTHQGKDGVTRVTRYEESTEYDFREAGDTEVKVRAMLGNEPIDSGAIVITISDSHLEMPNAFSPNNDQVNDYYQAKENHKSIVEFHAYIFNRWGQKLYEWTDYINEKSGWDGTFHGSPVKDGVYFVVVKARGADGREYNIRRDVNLIRRYNNLTNSTEGQE